MLGKPLGAHAPEVVGLPVQVVAAGPAGASACGIGRDVTPGVALGSLGAERERGCNWVPWDAEHVHLGADDEGTEGEDLCDSYAALDGGIKKVHAVRCD